ncbi:MAG: acetyl-CoA carboxylase biotin carboxyl carrier protein [bacterium]|nr:acetyl-CoA carboxylase biotin carboxyl carrier protein [bacterium]
MILKDMVFKDIDIDHLFKSMVEHDIAEVKISKGAVAVEVKRKHEPVIINQGTAVSRSMESVPATTDMRTGSAQAVNTNGSGNGKEDKAIPSESPAPGNGKAPSDSDNFHKVEAPLVGTFYRSPSPESGPFVEVGDKVNIGDVLCIVEAMKSMNEIPSDVSGTVREICVESSDMVEFEQVLFKIEAHG